MRFPDAVILETQMRQGGAKPDQVAITQKARTLNPLAVDKYSVGGLEIVELIVGFTRSR